MEMDADLGAETVTDNRRLVVTLVLENRCQVIAPQLHADTASVHRAPVSP